MTHPHLIQEAIDRVCAIARKDSLNGTKVPTGEEIFTRCALGEIYGKDSRNGDRSKMKRLYTSVRWAFEIHMNSDDEQ